MMVIFPMGMYVIVTFLGDFWTTMMWFEVMFCNLRDEIWWFWDIFILIIVIFCGWYHGIHHHLWPLFGRRCFVHVWESIEQISSKFRKMMLSRQAVCSKMVPFQGTLSNFRGVGGCKLAYHHATGVRFFQEYFFKLKPLWCEAGCVWNNLGT